MHQSWILSIYVDVRNSAVIHDLNFTKPSIPFLSISFRQNSHLALLHLLLGYVGQFTTIQVPLWLKERFNNIPRSRAKSNTHDMRIVSTLIASQLFQFFNHTFSHIKSITTLSWLLIEPLLTYLETYDPFHYPTLFIQSTHFIKYAFNRKMMSTSTCVIIRVVCWCNLFVNESYWFYLFIFTVTLTTPVPNSISTSSLSQIIGILFP